MFDVKPAKATVRDAGDAVFVEFALDVRPEEIESYLGDLPPEISPEKTGNRVKLQPSDTFFAFLGEKRRGGTFRHLGRVFRGKQS